MNTRTPEVLQGVSCTGQKHVEYWLPGGRHATTDRLPERLSQSPRVSSAPFFFFTREILLVFTRIFTLIYYPRRWTLNYSARSENTKAKNRYMSGRERACVAYDFLLFLQTSAGFSWCSLIVSNVGRGSKKLPNILEFHIPDRHAGSSASSYWGPFAFQLKSMPN